MDKFTDGPWNIKESKGFGSEIWREVFNESGLPIVSAAWHERTNFYGEQETISGVKIKEANASLIAAAPELLDALENLVASVNDGCGGAVDDAIAAIKKARGQQ